MNIREIYRLGISTFKLSTNKSVWGLEISDKRLKAVNACFSKGKLLIDSIDVIEYSSIGIKSGPNNPELIEEALRIFKERNLINCDKIIVSLSGKMILSRFFTLPPIKKNRINDVLRFELRKQVPFSPDEIVWDYQLFNDNGLANKDVNIVLFATKKENIYDLLPSLSSLSVNLESIQTAPIAIYNLLHFISDSDEDVIVMNVEKGNTDFIVVGRSKYWNRSIPVSEINMALIREIQRSIGYYTSISKNEKPDILYLMGNVFDSDKIKFVDENLDCKVRHLDLTDNIRVSKYIDNFILTNNKIYGFEIALGLTLQSLNLGKIKTNLLPHDYIKKKQSSRQKVFVSFILFSIFLGLLTQGIKDCILWKPLSNSVDTVTETLTKVRRLERAYQDIAKKTKVEKENLKALKSIGIQGRFMIEAISKIINTIPEDVFLISIESLWNLPKSDKNDKASDDNFIVGKRDMKSNKNIATSKKVLMVIIKGESYAPEVSHIEQNVKNSMVDLTLLNQIKPVFSDVRLVQGSVNRVTVLDNNNIERNNIGFTENQPISFEIQCTVNTIN